MITVYDGLNDLSQGSYDSMVQSLNLKDIECSCGNKGYLQFYGTYKRKIKKANQTCLIRIQRVRCNHCGITHAIIPSDIIPYDQILLKDQIAIIRLYESREGYLNLLNSNPEIDENNVAAIIRRYHKRWLEKMHGISVQELSEELLIQKSFEEHARQFLQIKETPNIFISTATADSRLPPDKENVWYKTSTESMSSFSIFLYQH